MGTSCVNNATRIRTRAVILELRTTKKLLFLSFLVSNVMCGQSILWGWGNNPYYNNSPRRLTSVHQGLGLLASSTPDQISIRSYSYPWWIRSNYTCYSLIHPFVPVFGSRCFFWEAKIKFINNRELCCIVRIVSVLYDPRKQQEYEFYPVTSTSTSTTTVSSKRPVPAFPLPVPPSRDPNTYVKPIVPESASANENRASTEPTIDIEQSAATRIKMSTSTTPVKILTTTTVPVPEPVPSVVKSTESQNTKLPPADPEDDGTARNPNEAEVMIQNNEILAQAENNQIANTTGTGNNLTDSNFTDNSTTKKTSLLAGTVITLPNKTESPTLTSQNPPGLIPTDDRNTIDNDNSLIPNLKVTTDTTTALTLTTIEQNNKILTSSTFDPSTFDPNGSIQNSTPDSTAVENETTRTPATHRPEKVNVTMGGSGSYNTLEKPNTTISVFAYDNFREPSQIFHVYDKCTTLPVDWQRRISSVNTTGTCVEVCQYRNCDGRCFRLAPGTLGHNRLRDVDFDKRITSLKACKK